MGEAVHLTDHSPGRRRADARHHLLGMTWNLLGMIKPPGRLTVTGRLVRDEA